MGNKLSFLEWIIPSQYREDLGLQRKEFGLDELDTK